MKRARKKKRPVGLLILVIGIAGAVIAYMVANDFRLGMREVTSFKADGICLNTTDPACGYCPGDVTDGKCYVRYGELKQYK